MKLLRSVSLAVLLVVVPILSVAATKKGISITEPVAVGNVVLKPGDYKVEWGGSGPKVQVNFVEEGKTVVTAPATLHNEATGYDEALDLTSRAGNETKSLKAIDFKNMSLVFDAANAAGK